jgi:hypothetical protein
MLYGSLLFARVWWILHQILWLLGTPLPQTDTTVSMSEMLGSFAPGGFICYSPPVVSWGWGDDVWGSMSPPHSKNCTVETLSTVSLYRQSPFTRRPFGKLRPASVPLYPSGRASISLDHPLIPEQSPDPRNLARLYPLSSAVNVVRHW